MPFLDWALHPTGQKPQPFDLPDPDPAAREQASCMINQYLDEVAESLKGFRQPFRDVHPFATKVSLTAADTEAGQAILEAEPSIQIAVVRHAVDWGLPYSRRFRIDNTERYYENRRVAELANSLLRRKLPYKTADVDWLLGRIALSKADWHVLEFCPVSTQQLLRSIARWSKDNNLSPWSRVSLTTIRNNIQGGHCDGRALRALAVIAEILGVDDTELIDAQDDWGQEASERLSELPSEQQSFWREVLTRTAAIKGTRPTNAWRKEIAELVASVEPDVFTGQLRGWFELLGRPTRGENYRRPDGFDYPTSYLADRNADMLKGLAWAATLVDDDSIAAVLGDAALACYKKIPGYGARSTKAGNACVHALAEIASLEAIGQLQRVLQRVKMPSQRSQIEQALATAAEARGLSAADLDELVVPTYGLLDGIVQRELGDFTAELKVSVGGNVDLRWLRADAKTQKSVPAPVKQDFPAEVKELKRTQKDLREALTVQRSRIEQLMLVERCWPVADWCERYIDHPLVSLIARRLLWTFDCGEQSAVGGWLDGELVGLDDRPIAWIDDDTRVRLWHPIESEADAVLAWREWLERHQITQPFKQAQREIYVLTDAERETETYSNRFAAHIIRQHQLNALCQQRGWRYRLQGAWDGFNVPTRELPGPGLQAEYWIEPVDDDDAVSHAYIYLYASTDQVQFVDSQSGETVPLDQVPPRIFSEVMRDVDLFVGVASIGADPNWLDGGPGRMDGYGDYWWDVSFGELTARAEVRRDTLARLLPRMAKLEGRWSLDGRYLTVNGDLRSYKIHLGSGNILMEPNDQYLCIVPGRGARGSRPGDGLFLPFEGDQTLSLILSKALMLAEDSRIADPSITRQIR